MLRSVHKAETFPVTLWQEYLLNEATHPDCTDDFRDRFIFASAYLMRPRIDVRRLRRAVINLRKRHDSLRIRFDRSDGYWQALIDPPGEDVLQQIDLGDQSDTAFQASISAISNAPLHIVDDPLAQVTVVKCGARGDVLVTRLHHAISDGFGMVLLGEEMAKLLVGIPIFGAAVSHAEYIARFQSPPPNRVAEIEAYWDEMHRDFPKAPQIGRKAKGLEPLIRGIGKVEQRQMTFHASPESLRRFETRMGAENVSATTALFAGYLESICQNYDLEKVMFMTYMSRTDGSMDTFAGAHLLNPVLAYLPGGENAFLATAKTLRDTLIRTLAHLPSDAARRGTAQDRALIDAGAYPYQFSVYQPRPMNQQRRSMFRNALSAGPGEEQRIGPLRVTSLDVSVRRRKLSDMQLDVGAANVRTGFVIHYDAISYTEQEISKIGSDMNRLLMLDQTDVIVE